MSPLRMMISPSKAEEKETGMSIFVIFNLMRASMECRSSPWYRHR